MTRKHVDSRTALTPRRRIVDEKVKSNMLVPSYDIANLSINEQQAEQYDSNLNQMHMYQFAGENNNHDAPAEYNIILPYSTPTLQFPAPSQVVEEDEAPQPNILHSLIADELFASGIYFEDQLNPFMQELIADENGERLPAPSHAEPEYVPVYPRWNPPVYHPPVSQTWSLDGPFARFAQATQPAPQAERRIAPAPQGKGQRFILPRGNVAPRGRAAPVDTFDVGEINQVRGRKRPLSPDARLAAREVRLMTACGRCQKKRERCTTVRPCKPCSGKNKRSLDLPCMRKLPEDRHPHLFTETLMGHFDLRQIQEDMPDRDPDKPPFKIHLNQYFDDPELIVEVAIFTPENPNHTKKSIFPIGRNDTGFVVQQTQITSPPLVPFFKNEESYSAFKKLFYFSVRRWLDQAEMHDHIGWHNTFFRPEYGKAWPRAIFGEICTFYHRVTKSGCPVLKSCLHTTVLVYMMGHSFYVPDNEVEEVLRKTSGPKFSGQRSEWVSPIYVDRFLKTLLLPVYKGAVKACLRGIQNLYSPARPSEFTRDRILAASIVLLIIAGSQQSKAIEKALARHHQGLPVDHRDVFDRIQEIEDHIVDLVLELWTYKFAPDAKMGADDPADRFESAQAKEFNLLERFKESYFPSDDAEDLESLPTSLPVFPGNLDSQKFGANNIERILKKFHMCVFPDE